MEPLTNIKGSGYGSDRQQRFLSTRRYAVGLVSVLVGCFFVGYCFSPGAEGGQVDVPALVVRKSPGGEFVNRPGQGLNN